MNVLQEFSWEFYCSAITHLTLTLLYFHLNTIIFSLSGQVGLTTATINNNITEIYTKISVNHLSLGSDSVLCTLYCRYVRYSM